jgi:hypothetical protein
MPSVLPRSTVKDRPSTALTSPSSVGKRIWRSLTSTKACGVPKDDRTSSTDAFGDSSDREVMADLAQE